MPLAGRLVSFTLLAGGLFAWAPTGGWSNDPSRRYVDPTLALTLRYRWR